MYTDDGMTVQLLLLLIFIFFVIIGILTAREDEKKEKREQEEAQRAAIEQEERFLRQTRSLQDAYNLNPQEFEELIRLLFQKLGFQAHTTQYVSDGGIDINLLKDGKRQLVQCKRHKGTISVQTVREFFGVMVDQQVEKGYIISTGHFTLPARRFAEGKGIHLIDGPELAEMLDDL